MTKSDMQEMKRSMEKVYDEADCLYSAMQIGQAIKRVGDQISDDLADSNPIVIAVMNGGLVFGGQLLTHLNFPLQFDYAHATRYQDKTTGDQLQWKVTPSILMSGRTVLLVDDILDQGHTLLAIEEYCHQQKADRVYTAVLLDKTHDRKAQEGLKADYTGLPVQDRFVFGYGLDYKGYWRNAPGIYAVKGL